MDFKKEDYWFNCRNCNVSIESTDILKNINLDLKFKENVVILGLNGSGKSTLLKLIARFIFPTNRSESFLKILNSSFPEIGEIRKKIGFFSYEAINKRDTNLKIFNLLTATLRNKFYSKFMNDLYFKEEIIPSDKEREIINELILEYDIQHLKNKKYNTLSAGQKQIINLIIHTLNKPLILLIDEPYNHLDLKYKLLFKNILNKIMIKGITVVLVTHDLNNISEDFQKVILLKDGSIYKQGNIVDVINNKNISHIIDKDIKVNYFKKSWNIEVL